MNTQTQEKTFEEYYLITEHWLADCNFFEDELNFFEKLITRNLIFSLDDRYLVKLQHYLARIHDFTAERHSIHVAILGHMEELEKAIRNNFASQPTKISLTHEMLRGRVINFINGFLLYKSKLYNSAEMLTGNSEPDLLLN